VVWYCVLWCGGGGCGVVRCGVVWYCVLWCGVGWLDYVRGRQRKEQAMQRPRMFNATWAGVVSGVCCEGGVPGSAAA
jgi:hypothetical protein